MMGARRANLHVLLAFFFLDVVLVPPSPFRFLTPRSARSLALAADAGAPILAANASRTPALTRNGDGSRQASGSVDPRTAAGLGVTPPLSGRTRGNPTQGTGGGGRGTARLRGGPSLGPRAAAPLVAPPPPGGPPLGSKAAAAPAASPTRGGRRRAAQEEAKEAGDLTTTTSAPVPAAAKPGPKAFTQPPWMAAWQAQQKKQQAKAKNPPMFPKHRTYGGSGIGGSVAGRGGGGGGEAGSGGGGDA